MLITHDTTYLDHDTPTYVYQLPTPRAFAKSASPEQQNPVKRDDRIYTYFYIRFDVPAIETVVGFFPWTVVKFDYELFQMAELLKGSPPGAFTLFEKY